MLHLSKPNPETLSNWLMLWNLGVLSLKKTEDYSLELLSFDAPLLSFLLSFFDPREIMSFLLRMPPLSFFYID